MFVCAVLVLADWQRKLMYTYIDWRDHQLLARGIIARTDAVSAQSKLIKGHSADKQLGNGHQSMSMQIDWP